MSDFKASSIRIGNLAGCLTESFSGDLIFTDKKVPQGISLLQLANPSITKSNISGFKETDYVHTEGNETIYGDKSFKGVIFGDIGLLKIGSSIIPIDSNTLDIGSSTKKIKTLYIGTSIHIGNNIVTSVNGRLLVDGTNIVNETIFNSISGSLQDQISYNTLQIGYLGGSLNNSINNIQSQVNTISGNLDTLQHQVDNLDLSPYATNSYVLAISGDLQSRIDNIPVVDLSPYTLTSITSSISAGLDGRLDILQDQFDNLDITYATDISVNNIQSQVNTISGNLDILQDQFDNLDLSPYTLLTTTASISSGVYERLDILESIDHNSFATTSYVDEISGNLDALQNQFDNLDATYVNSSGDTMVGDLTIVPLSGSGNSQLYVNSDGKLTRSVYNNIIGGYIQLSSLYTSYTITDSNITYNSNPVCSIKSSMPDDTMLLYSISNVKNGSFDVELSMSPPISGYYLHWLSF